MGVSEDQRNPNQAKTKDPLVVGVISTATNSEEGRTLFTEWFPNRSRPIPGIREDFSERNNMEGCAKKNDRTDFKKRQECTYRRHKETEGLTYQLCRIVRKY